MTRPVLTVVGVFSAAAVLAQSLPAGPRFEVTAIRRNLTESTGGTIGMRPGGRWFATNTTARTLIGIAWGVPSGRVIGAPDWATVERYAIEAAAGKERPSPDETSRMVQAMLRDRFKAAVRVEKRDTPVYFLVVARPDGRLGPRLQRPAFDCADPAARTKAAAAAHGRVPVGIRYETGRMTAGCAEVSVLEASLGGTTGRPVLNRTGLTGFYDIDLEWTPTLGADAPAGDTVSIFTAVQEQLGLKLESGTAPLDVAVVERLERPSEN